MPSLPQILQVLLRASVHCCLSKSEVFPDCNCIWLWLKQCHRLKAVHIPLWACFSDLSVQRVFLGLRTWHNMTCCQVSKHGVAGDETAASGKQIGDLMYALISFHPLEPANICDLSYVLWYYIHDRSCANLTEESLLKQKKRVFFVVVGGVDFLFFFSFQTFLQKRLEFLTHSFLFMYTFTH